MAAHREVPRDLSAAERLARTLSRAGVSITITSRQHMCRVMRVDATGVHALALLCPWLQ